MKLCLNLFFLIVFCIPVIAQDINQELIPSEKVEKKEKPPKKRKENSGGVYIAGFGAGMNISSSNVSNQDFHPQNIDGYVVSSKVEIGQYFQYNSIFRISKSFSLIIPLSYASQGDRIEASFNNTEETRIEMTRRFSTVSLGLAANLKFAKSFFAEVGIELKQTVQGKGSYQRFRKNNTDPVVLALIEKDDFSTLNYAILGNIGYWINSYAFFQAGINYDLTSTVYQNIETHFFRFQIGVGFTL